MTPLTYYNQMVPLDTLEGFKVRPGFYDVNGATALSDGVCFTIHSQGATSCELLLFRPDEDEPFAVLKYPDNYRIGNVFSMIVYDLDVSTFHYAFRMDGPYDKKKGLLFDKNKHLLDPYAKAVVGQSEWVNHQIIVIVPVLSVTTLTGAPQNLPLLLWKT